MRKRVDIGTKVKTDGHEVILWSPYTTLHAEPKEGFPLNDLKRA